MFKNKCPKCGGTKITVVKETLADDMKRSMLNLVFPIRFIIGTGKKPKPLYVCQDDACGFSWEKR